ncbi:CAP domain-containing protein [Georgenia sp. SYP-B2076]|uniref:CAP domain-containing protein n=1 Tax=Georgenia sp. SYP-B2076 TaxID=2495881 RepID=UPI0013DEFF96|nr:CAP domain-containing protein [Georgenia sp. SYP-B2076]
MSVQSARYRRTLAAVAAAAVAIPVGLATAPAFASPAPSPVITATQAAWTLEVEAEVFNRINEYRQSQGVAPLTRNSAVDALARGWSETQAAQSNMSHNPQYGQQMPAGASSWSENVAYLSGYSTAEMAGVFVDGWIDSEGHRRNLLDPKATHTGVGVAQNAGGEVYATQNFGSYAGALPGDAELAPAPIEQPAPAAPAEEPALAPMPVPAPEAATEQEPAKEPAEQEPATEPAEGADPAPAEEPASSEEPASAEHPAPTAPADEAAGDGAQAPAEEEQAPADGPAASEEEKPAREKLGHFERLVLEFLLSVFRR